MLQHILCVYTHWRNKGSSDNNYSLLPRFFSIAAATFAAAASAAAATVADQFGRVSLLADTPQREKEHKTNQGQISRSTHC